MPNNSGICRLTDKREAFVLELVKGKSQREAYKIAYPKSVNWKNETIDSNASRLFKNDKVKARFEELQAKVRAPDEASAIMTAQEILAELTAMAKGLKEYPITDMFGNEYKRKTTVNERIKCLELLGKNYAIFTDRVKTESDTRLTIEINGVQGDFDES